METTEDKVLKYGRSLITNFCILVKITGMYDSMNEAVMNAVKRFMADIERFISDTGEFTLKIVEGSFYVEGIRVKAQVADMENFTHLADELKKKSIGVLDFRAPVQSDDLIYLAYAIKGGAEASEVQSLLESKLTKGIAVGGPVALQKEEGVDLKDLQAVAKRAYLKTAAAVGEMDNALKAGRRVKLKKIKRAIQLMVDSIMGDESYVLGFTTIRNAANYYYCHPVNVAILATVLGKRIGLNRVLLRNLAMAAFFHDAGKVHIPFSILSKAEEFSPKEVELIRHHPEDGVKVLLKTFGMNEITIISMLVSYEHHMRLDLSGYPETEEGRGLSIFSRIISIADEFDSMVSGRVYERAPRTTEDALKTLVAGGGKQYDPTLVKAFVGIFQ